MEGVDYAWDRPSPAGLFAAGVRFAGRYVGVGSAGKWLTVDERDALADAGIAIVTLVEGAATGALDGYGMGVSHARAARSHAAGLGMPDGRPFYFAVDFDATPSQLETVSNYFRGVASVLPFPQVGVYGGIRTIDYLLPRGLAAWGFQTYAWSAGRWSPLAKLRQYRNHVEIAGGTVDLCHAMTDDIGQWMPEGKEDMTPEQDAALKTVLWAVGNFDDGSGGRIPLQDWGSRLAATVAALEAKVDALAGALVESTEPDGLAVTLGADDREAIVTAVVAGLVTQMGLAPTASEVGKAIVAEISKYLPR